jgi:hypothetical protein
MKRLFLLVSLVVLSCGSAFAWNCSDPQASRVDVGTANPGGASGNGDGQWFLGTGSEGTKGHYYVCEVPKPKTPKTGNGGSCKGHSCNSTSGSSSTSSATGGNSSSTATGGSATSSSGVSNSGNSSNTNTNNNTAQGGAGGNATQGQKQGQSQTQSSSSDNSGGNSSNSYSSNTNVEAPKIPVATAFAPTTIPTVSCFKGFGAGVQTMPVGASFGGGKIDENCRALQTALHAPNRVTYCKIYINLQDSKKAGITMADCMATDPEPPVVEEKKPEVNIYLPPQAAPVAPPVVPVAENKPFLGQIGVCTFAKVVSCTPEKGVTIVTPTGVCKQQLQAAKAALDLYPGTILIIRGNRNPSEAPVTAQSRATNVKKQLEEYGVASNRLRTEVGTGTARTVQLILAEQ